MSHPAILPGVSLSDQRTGLERLKFAVEKNRAGETGFDGFDFSTFRNECGTVGCVAGSFPTIWPDSWTWDLTAMWPIRIDVSEQMSTYIRFAQWFSISNSQSSALFHPAVRGIEDFSPVFPGAIWLTGDSELSDVLSNLETFIAWKEAALIEAETAQAVEMAGSEASHPGFSGVGGI